MNMKSRTLTILLFFLIASIQIPQAAAVNQQGMSWGVEESTTIYYNFLRRTHNLGDTITVSERIYLEVLRLPEIPDYIDNMTSLPFAEVEILYENASLFDRVTSIQYPIFVALIGNYTIMRETYSTSQMQEYGISWIEDAWVWGWQQNFENLVFASNSTMHFSKTDGALQYYDGLMIDKASGEELEFVQIMRDDNSIPITISIFAIGLIIAVIIVFESRRRSPTKA